MIVDQSGSLFLFTPFWKPMTILIPEQTRQFNDSYIPRRRLVHMMRIDCEGNVNAFNNRG